MAINLLDITSNNNDLTNNNGATEVTTGLPFAASTIAVDFERDSSQSLSIANASQTGLNVGTTFSFECWLKIETLPANPGNALDIVSKWKEGGHFSYLLNFINNGGTLGPRLLVSDDGTNLSVAFVAWTPTAGVWYHLAVTVSSVANETKFYVNGSQQGATQTAARSGYTSSTAAFYIGYRDASGEYFDGVLDEVRIWNDVRTSTEISDNKSVELVGNEAGLVAYWPFEVISPATAGGTNSRMSLLGVGI